MRERLDSAGLRAFGTLVRIAILVSLFGCAIPGPPSPRTEYSATVVVSVSSVGAEPSSTTVVESYQDGKRRREAVVEGKRVIAIDRPDLRVAWILDPDSRTFKELTIRDATAEIRAHPNPFGPRAGGRFEALGSEVVDGVAATKYGVEGAGISGLAWLRADAVPLRFEGTMTVADEVLRVDVRYGPIEIGRQPAYDFVIPRNYAGYENRKRERRESASSVSKEDVDRWRRRMEEQSQGRGYPMIPPL